MSGHRRTLPRSTSQGRENRPIRARVDLALYRGATRVRTLARGVRGAGTTHRVVLRPRGLRRGLYTVLLSVRLPDGRTQVARLASRRL